MELRTDTQKLTFILEAEAELADFLADGELSAQAADRPKYITNYFRQVKSRCKPKCKPKKKQPGKIKSDAGIRPLAIEDRNLSLGERLSAGIMAGYRQRVPRNQAIMED